MPYGTKSIEELIVNKLNKCLYQINNPIDAMEVVKQHFELANSKVRIEQLKNKIESLNGIEEENSYLRGLLKLYL